MSQQLEQVCCDDVSSAQVDQLFTHLSQQLVHVRSSLSDVIQRRYEHYTSLTGDDEIVDDISRQLTALRAVVDYTDKVHSRDKTGSEFHISQCPH